MAYRDSRRQALEGLTRSIKAGAGRRGAPATGAGAAFAAALLATVRAAEATDGTSRVFTLTPQQVLQSGEREVGGLGDVVNRVDRLYDGQAFGVAEDGSRAISNETLSSFLESAATVTFDDGTTLVIGPNSEVILDEYMYDPATNEGTLSLNILSGLVKFVSGSMTKDSYAIETPSGLAGIRGTELVFLVELDGETYLGVFEGATAFSVEGQVIATAAADNAAGNAIVLSTDASGAVVARTEALSAAFSTVDIVFSDPQAYSRFAAEFKTEAFQPAVLDACLSGRSCEAVLNDLVDEYGSLGVDPADVQAGLESLGQAIDASGAAPGSVADARASLDRIAAEVQANYSPTVKASDPAAQASVDGGSGGLGLSGVPQNVLLGLGLGAGNIALNGKGEDSGSGSNGMQGQQGGGNQPGVDNPPTDIRLSDLNIEDGSVAGDVVASLTVTDDFTDNANIVYKIVPNVGQFDSFAIDPLAQTLVMTDSVDANDRNTYNVTIEATDEARNTYQESFVIDVIFP